ncbi:ribonuclease M5 [Dolosicoccus paucivorans]|uniref:Ribonuclease M5 n=1 Tax=Dolosicoccus paucivorans TaxID=84521 RepID=A0A1G8NL34_9LACT|nr:ribonuclease M5 [Dolosicoccus paucivorans]PMB83689.1 ribonuclease M5 [Dolosicoccus paucivorans]PMC57874.1 ribonuclease M5 [Dolosicoccus paucivorans]SDI80888.1 RNAse M5 [Dolosicoccus paucivorans]
MTSSPKEVIVVEGKSDTARLKQCFGPEIRTIETGGSALDEETLEQIKKAQEVFGVIVFTDPDTPGQLIRRQISQFIPTVQHAHLLQKEAQSKKEKESLGVEHASLEHIRQALDNVLTYAPRQDGFEITMADLMHLGLAAGPKAQQKRFKIAHHFKLGHVNAKQLHKALMMYQIPLDEVKKVLEESEDMDERTI